MATNPKKWTTSPEHAASHDGFGRWLLGAVGLFWVGSLAARALRAGRAHQSPGVTSDHPRWPSPQIKREWSARATSPTRGHEKLDANAKWLFWVIGFLFIFGLAIHGILAWFQSSLKHTAPPTDRWQPVQPTPRAGSVPQRFPVLQVSPPLDLQTFRAREQAELETYGWINRTAGVVRIPIERAMDLVLQQGLPSREGPQGEEAGKSSYDLILQRPEQRQP